MTNELIVKTTLDNSEIDKQLSDLQKKIKDMVETGPGGAMAQLSQQHRSNGQEETANRIDQVRQRAMKQKQNDMLIYKKQLNVELEKELKNQEGILKLLESHVIAVDHRKRKEIELSNSINLVDKTSQGILNINKAIGLDNNGPPPRGPNSGGGFGGPPPRGPNSGGFDLFSMAIAGLGLGGRAAKFIGNSQLQARTRAERVSGAQASVAGVLSEAATLQSERRGYEMAYYGPERVSAMKMAKERMDAEKFKDKADLGRNILQGISGAALTVAGAGTMLAGAGLAPFTGGGSAVLGVPAGAAMMAGGGAMMANAGSGYFGGDDRKTSMLFNQEDYSSLVGAEGAKTYKKALMTEKLKDPKKMIADKFFKENSDRMLKTQRAFGLSDEDLGIKGKNSESIYVRARRAGFRGDQVEQQMASMLSAGGTTAASRDGGVMASKMGRNLDLTNAAAIMGKISGRSGMSAEQSKDETIRMYAEATRMGLDASEVRNLLETSSQIAFQSGATGTEIQSLLQLGDVSSSRGLQASVNALDSIRKKTGSTSGLKMQNAFATYGSDDFAKTMKDFGGDASKIDLGFINSMAGTNVVEMGKENKGLEQTLATIGINYEDLSEKQKEELFAYLRQKQLTTTRRGSGRGDALNKVKDAERNLKNAKKPEEKKKARFALKAAQGEYKKSLEIEDPDVSGMADPEQQSLMKIYKGIDEAKPFDKATKKQLKAAEAEFNKTKASRGADKKAIAEAQGFANTVGILKGSLKDLIRAFDTAATAEAWTLLQNLSNKLIAAGKMTDEGQKTMFDAIQKQLQQGKNMSFMTGGQTEIPYRSQTAATEDEE